VREFGWTTYGCAFESACYDRRPDGRRAERHHASDIVHSPRRRRLAFSRPWIDNSCGPVILLPTFTRETWLMLFASLVLVCGRLCADRTRGHSPQPDSPRDLPRWPSVTHPPDSSSRGPTARITTLPDLRRGRLLAGGFHLQSLPRPRGHETRVAQLHADYVIRGSRWLLFAERPQAGASSIARLHRPGRLIRRHELPLETSGIQIPVAPTRDAQKRRWLRLVATPRILLFDPGASFGGGGAVRRPRRRFGG